MHRLVNRTNKKKEWKTRIKRMAFLPSHGRASLKSTSSCGGRKSLIWVEAKKGSLGGAILSTAAKDTGQYLYMVVFQLLISQSGENINTADLFRVTNAFPQAITRNSTERNVTMPAMSARLFFSLLFSALQRTPRNRTRRQTMQDSYGVVFFPRFLISSNEARSSFSVNNALRVQMIQWFA